MKQKILKELDDFVAEVAKKTDVDIEILMNISAIAAAATEAIERTTEENTAEIEASFSEMIEGSNNWLDEYLAQK